MATHSSVLAWRIPGTEEPRGLPSMGSHRVGHDWSDLAVAGVVVMHTKYKVWVQTPNSFSQLAPIPNVPHTLLQPSTNDPPPCHNCGAGHIPWWWGTWFQGRPHGRRFTSAIPEEMGQDFPSRDEGKDFPERENISMQSEEQCKGARYGFTSQEDEFQIKLWH